jgi:hypothetical protein
MWYMNSDVTSGTVKEKDKGQLITSKYSQGEVTNLQKKRLLEINLCRLAIKLNLNAQFLPEIQYVSVCTK